jgi:hypothetical protein
LAHLAAYSLVREQQPDHPSKPAIPSPPLTVNDLGFAALKPAA